MKQFWLFPHQLFENVEPLRGYTVKLIEAPLFFTQYRFHVQKLMLHRATMKAYEAYLKAQNIAVLYVEVAEAERLQGRLVTVYDVADDYLLRDIRSRAGSVWVLDSLNFLYGGDDNLFMHRFYIHHRRRLGILTEGEKPVGGQWSFDEANRKKLPADLKLPAWIGFENRWIAEARSYVERFETFGSAESFYWPVTFEEADMVPQRFFGEHFERFGDTQDAMTPVDSPLFHSMLSAVLNVGFLSPEKLIKQALESEAPLNAKEGFIRQIIGWREFMRHTYASVGVRQRTTNFFGFTRKMPKKVLEGKTGIVPLDDVMAKVHTRAYAHHIERLMILGNLFLLMEIDPDEVYAFFMRGFIDAYDWVMVGNVYGMSQFADGGLITTKPYISGSNYILKMSRYAKGEWCGVWDALFWRFIERHGHRFAGNNRMRMVLRNWERMSETKRQAHLERASQFLNSLDDGGAV